MSANRYRVSARRVFGSKKNPAGPWTDLRQYDIGGSARASSAFDDLKFSYAACLFGLCGVPWYRYYACLGTKVKLTRRHIIPSTGFLPHCELAFCPLAWLAYTFVDLRSTDFGPQSIDNARARTHTIKHKLRSPLCRQRSRRALPRYTLPRAAARPPSNISLPRRLAQQTRYHRARCFEMAVGR